MEADLLRRALYRYRTLASGTKPSLLLLKQRPASAVDNVLVCDFCNKICHSLPLRATPRLDAPAAADIGGRVEEAPQTIARVSNHLYFALRGLRSGGRNCSISAYSSSVKSL
jgi:hypothetical protein